MWLGEGRLLNIANKVQGSPKGRYNKPYRAPQWSMHRCYRWCIEITLHYCSESILIYNVQQWNWFHKNLNKFKNTFLQQNYNIYFIFHKVDRKTAEFSHRKKIEVSSVFKAENIMHVQLMKVQVFRNGYKSFVERYLIKSTE